jgi:hypothetical protein
VTFDVLLALQEAHAFDPFPVREDLGVYYVPFSELAGDGHIDQALGDGCRRYERVAIVGDSGTGKSSLTASVLGPLAEGVAPVVVPVAIEPNEAVSEPRAMFAHVAAVIARVAADAAALSSTEREQALARLTSQRPVGRVGGRSLRLGGGWMGANVSAELARQAGPPQLIDRSASETLEVIEQMLATIHSEGLVPVLVFDDTDRWLSGSFRDHEDLARSFFGRVLPALAGLRCSIVVAVHRRYLTDDALRGDIDRVLETVIEVPPLRDSRGVGAVLQSRVHAHRLNDDNTTLVDVIDADAIDRLFDLYRTGPRGELRGVLRTAHVALADACDSGADVISTPLIDGAFAAWDSA